MILTASIGFLAGNKYSKVIDISSAGDDSRLIPVDSGESSQVGMIRGICLPRLSRIPNPVMEWITPSKALRLVRSCRRAGSLAPFITICVHPIAAMAPSVIQRYFILCEFGLGSQAPKRYKPEKQGSWNRLVTACQMEIELLVFEIK